MCSKVVVPMCVAVIKYIGEGKYEFITIAVYK